MVAGRKRLLGRIHSGLPQRGISDGKVQYLLLRRMGCLGCGLAWMAQAAGRQAMERHRQAAAQGRPREAQTTRERLKLPRKQPRAPTALEELSRLVRRYINARRDPPWNVNQLLQHMERT
jgi:hypothetical protein